MRRLVVVVWWGLVGCGPQVTVDDAGDDAGQDDGTATSGGTSGASGPVADSGAPNPTTSPPMPPPPTPGSTAAPGDGSDDMGDGVKFDLPVGAPLYGGCDAETPCAEGECVAVPFAPGLVWNLCTVPCTDAMCPTVNPEGATVCHTTGGPDVVCVPVCDDGALCPDYLTCTPDESGLNAACLPGDPQG